MAWRQCDNYLLVTQQLCRKTSQTFFSLHWKLATCFFLSPSRLKIMRFPVLLPSVLKLAIVLKAILKYGIQMGLLEWEDTKRKLAYVPTMHSNTAWSYVYVYRSNKVTGNHLLNHIPVTHLLTWPRPWPYLALKTNIRMSYVREKKKKIRKGAGSIHRPSTLFPSSPPNFHSIG